MFDDYDLEKVRWAIIIIALLVMIIGASIYTYQYVAEKEYREECENNPTLRYAQPCKSYPECVSICISTLKNQSGESSLTS